jgi:hypothetical protein
MNISLAAADAILARTLHLLNDEDRSLLSALDELPAPIYVTDADGVITYIIQHASPSQAECRRWAETVGASPGSYSPKMAHPFLTTSVRWPTRS